MNHQDDRTILRELASQVAEIAALPLQEEKRHLWRKLNGLQMERPMVTIDQVCWNEMERDGELTLRCQGPDARYYEDFFRKTLYQWKYFRVDMVVEPFMRVPMAVHNSGFGIEVTENIAVSDATNSVVGHAYLNQFQSMEDVEKIQEPRITHDPVETKRRLEQAEWFFGDLLAIKPWGMDPYLSIWDPISTWMGVENALYGIIDKPEMMHAIAERVTSGYLSQLDQLENLGVLCGEQSLIHCTGAQTDELPAPGFDPAKPRTKDIWMFGLAQMFSTVSPAMFKEYEVDYASRICERFGLVYYGCCDPLDGKMKQVRMIPNVRKVSMSPWVRQERGAEQIGRDYVFSRKPSPAMLAYDDFDEEMVRQDLTHTRDICRNTGSPLELILKDISTVRYEPQRLSRWAEIAMEVVCG